MRRGENPAEARRHNTTQPMEMRGLSEVDVNMEANLFVTMSSWVMHVSILLDVNKICICAP